MTETLVRCLKSTLLVGVFY